MSVEALKGRELKVPCPVSASGEAASPSSWIDGFDTLTGCLYGPIHNQGDGSH